MDEVDEETKDVCQYSLLLGDMVEGLENSSNNNISLSTMKTVYLDLLKQSLLERSKNVDKDKSDTSRGEYEYKRSSEWLEKTDFFTSPASSRFHESYEGGLVEHTLRVYNEAMDLMQVSCFNKLNVEDVTLVALIHDWCKICTYESYDKNVKNETTGQWEKQKAYRKVPSKFPFGHGETSMYIGMKFFHMNEGEALALRWHMGKWYTPDAEDDELSEASHKYPMVYLIQFADQLALKEY